MSASMVEVSLDDIPDAGKEWNHIGVSSSKSSAPSKPRGITVTYPKIQHNPPAPDAKPRRSILKSTGGTGAKSRKKVKFNNRGRPAGNRDKTSKNVDAIVKS